MLAAAPEAEVNAYIAELADQRDERGRRAGEPLAAMMRRGSTGSNTTADQLQVLGNAIAALPPKFRRRLMVTADGAGASHGLITRLDQLASRPGHQLTYCVGWVLGAGSRAGRPCRIARQPGHGYAPRDNPLTRLDKESM
jgi:hypothetical protein